MSRTKKVIDPVTIEDKQKNIELMKQYFVKKYSYLNLSFPNNNKIEVQEKQND